MNPVARPIALLLVALALQPSLRPALAQPVETYPRSADSQEQPGVPKGKVTEHQWNQSRIFPGTTRSYWVYVPAQYQPTTSAAVMIFQDGGGDVRTNGDWRVPIVFDNLIHKGEMPVTIGIFINPGVVPAPHTNALPRYNRSFEYDGLGDRYARFLLEEILPEVGKSYNLTTNATGRAIAGRSSGGICAFTAAWERPDAFGRVLSAIGTFVGLRGGDAYPTLIRKTEPKPIRVYLQDGSNDNNGYGGNWYLANQEMLSALQFSGYDVQAVWGEGGHNGKHSGAILPDALRWLWKDYPNPIRTGTSDRAPVQRLIVPGEGWEVVASGYKFTEGPTANSEGELFFTDIPSNRILKIGLDGAITTFAENTGGASGLKFGRDGLLYACTGGTREIVSYSKTGERTVLVKNVQSNDLTVSDKGVYFTDPANKKVWFVRFDGTLREVDQGIANPNGVALSPDQTLLMVSDTAGRFVFSFQILADGSLTNKQAYHHLHLADGKYMSGADGMTVDVLGNLYVTSEVGVQIFDQLGRATGLLTRPQTAWLSNVAFGGPNLETLYATSSDKVFRRKMKVRGVIPAEPPLKPKPTGL